MLVEKELQAAARMEPKPIVRIVKTARSFNRRIVPSPAAQNEGRQPRCTQWIDQGGYLHWIAVHSGIAEVVPSIVR